MAEKSMSRREFLQVSTVAGAMVAAGGMLAGGGGTAAARDLAPIQVPRPQGGGDTLFRLLEKRASARQFSPEPLPAAMLAGLVWAACGVSRPDGRRTAPTALNRQDMDLYVATRDGLYLFDPKGNVLQPVATGDIRKLTGTQPYVGEAAANLVYVADMSKARGVADDQRMFYAGSHTGFMSQNVYLYCASQGLATVVRASIDRDALGKAMKLRPDQVITLAQSVGYPKKGA